MLQHQRIRHLAGSVRRLIVHHEQPDVGMLHQPADQQRQVVAFVVGRHDNQRGGRRRSRRRGHGRRLSKRSEEICSETRPTRKMITLNRISSTDELVMCDWVMIVQIAYPAPTKNAAALIGRNTRIGLKIVITLRRITKNCSPSAPSLIFDEPCRTLASIGSNHTLYPALMKASVVVVGV